MNSTKRIIDNHNKRILTSSQANDVVTTAATEVAKHATADKRTLAHSPVTAYNLALFTKPQ